MLDTNTCIFVLKNRPDKVRKKFKVIKDICISSVTYGELCFGIENSPPNRRKVRWTQLDDFTQQILIEPWDERAARHHGFVRAFLKAKEILSATTIC
ncbi:MAG: type II toxin-antitoxin system VapC family toxin [Gammaproteobacteria bacterium]